MLTCLLLDKSMPIKEQDEIKKSNSNCSLFNKYKPNLKHISKFGLSCFILILNTLKAVNFYLQHSDCQKSY